MRFVCAADTHTMHGKLPVPDGDVFLFAGDLTDVGALDDVFRFDDYLASLPHKHRIVIAGNHDFAFEKTPREARAALTNCVYLQDSGIELGGVRIYGSPWQPWFCAWAFNLQRGAEIKAKWDLIPGGTDILVTHGPPMGHGDEVLRPEGRKEKTGCADLLDAIGRIRPKYHVFGHIHEGYGTTKDEHTVFINASACDREYRPVNPPVVFDYP